jgi:hypothetical protein
MLSSAVAVVVYVLVLTALAHAFWTDDRQARLRCRLGFHGRCKRCGIRARCPPALDLPGLR